jgi:tripartite-type tricarboxylate transporter receptor subunit TctC
MRRVVLALCALLLAVPAAAQSYPTKPVRLIVPYQAGQGTDVAARYVAERLGAALGQQVIVDNKPGAGGNIGTEAAAHAPNDGYTLLMGTVATQTMNEFLYPVDRLRLGQGFHADHPGRHAADGDLGQSRVSRQDDPGADRRRQGAARQDQRRPAQHDRAHRSTSCSRPRPARRLFGVPYKASATAMTETMGGQVPVIIDTATATRGHVQAGKLKPLGITTLKSSELLPGVKSVAEQGVDGFEVTAWAAMYAPAGTPKEIVDRLNAEVAKILALPETRQRLLQLGFEPAGGTPEQLAAFEKQERAKWGPLIKAAGLKAD